MLHDGACPQRWIRAVSLPRGPGLPMAANGYEEEAGRAIRRHDDATRPTQSVQFSPVSPVQPVQSSPVHFSPALHGTATLLNAVKLHLSAPHLILARSAPMRQVRYAYAPSIHPRNPRRQQPTTQPGQVNPQVDQQATTKHQASKQPPRGPTWKRPDADNHPSAPVRSAPLSPSPPLQPKYTHYTHAHTCTSRQLPRPIHLPLHLHMHTSSAPTSCSPTNLPRHPQPSQLIPSIPSRLI
jgi:hypothetical protein